MLTRWALMCLLLAWEGSVQARWLARWAPWEDTPNALAGRMPKEHPAPRCCVGEACIEKSRGRHAFVASVRSSEYLTGLLELHCSLQATNPQTKLVVMTVKGDLTQKAAKELRQLDNTELRYQEEFRFPNTLNERFSKNWVKLRAWEMTDYDSIIMLDTDMVVLGSLEHLFYLPTDFALVPNQGYNGWAYNAGGFVFLRPCPEVFEAMKSVLAQNPNLQFPTQFAEQTFLTWWFAYTMTKLPMEYNANFDFADTNLIGLADPLVMHFANEKPFEATPDSPEWPWLCWQPQQQGQPNQRFTAKHRESHNQTHPKALLHDHFQDRTEAPAVSGKSFLHHWRRTGLG